MGELERKKQAANSAEKKPKKAPKQKKARKGTRRWQRCRLVVVCN